MTFHTFCVKSQNQLPFYSKMWNSSFCREGCGLTGDIWIISDESESGTLNTFRCFRKLPQFATDSESERMYIFLSPEDYFRNQEKMWDKVVKSLSFRPFPFMQVITMAFFGSRTWSYCFTCADDHHGVLEFVELVLCPSLQAGDKCIQWLSVPWNLLQVNNGSLQCSSRLDQVHGPRGSSGGVARCLSK